MYKAGKQQTALAYRRVAVNIGNVSFNRAVVVVERSEELSEKVKAREHVLSKNPTKQSKLI